MFLSFTTAISDRTTDKTVIFFFFGIFSLFCSLFVFSSMDFPPIQILCLEQGDRLLEDHKGLFPSSVPDTLPRTANIPADGPRDNFATFVEWGMVNNSSFNVAEAHNR